MILGDSTGCHRGTKPVTTDRDIVIINYGLHPEYGFVGGVLTMDGVPKAKIARSDLNSLAEGKVAAADFLEVVDVS